MTALPQRPRRSALYVPAINQRAIDKSRQLDMDTVIYDLEDAIAPDMKGQARAQLIDAFRQGGFGHRETVIRINANDTEDYALDLDTVALCHPDAVLIPKVSSSHALEDVARRLSAKEGGKKIGVWAMIETTAALLHLDAIVADGIAMEPALQCLVVGTNDIAKETGVDTGDERRYLLPWLMQIVLVAKHHGITVLDGVWNDFSDKAGFDTEAMQARRMAFDGKTLIHPTQVEPSNRLFSPSAQVVADARAIVAAFAQPENIGKGVINLNGKMVERLHAAQAQRVLAISDAITTRT